MAKQEVRKQMEAAAHELWGKSRAKDLAEPIAATAAALARLDAVELGSADDFDYLEGR